MLRAELRAHEHLDYDGALTDMTADDARRSIAQGGAFVSEAVIAIDLASGRERHSLPFSLSSLPPPSSLLHGALPAARALLVWLFY
jgi:hypothetical protein